MAIYQTLSQLANQCVMCGLCLPHCPTYQLFQTESESPRGRIALLKALAEKQLDITPGMSLALDHCLNCRACEKMCPSQVDYASISRLGRELMTQLKPKQQPLKQKLAEKLLLKPALHPFLKLTSRAIAPLEQMLTPQSEHSSLGHFIHEIASDSSTLKSLKSFYPANHAIGQVILFKGCSGDLFEQHTLYDSILLLNACGYNVVIPDKSSCCGAIKLRHGDAKGLQTTVNETANNLAPLLTDSQAIIVLNNSCSGQLKDYRKLKQLDDSDQLADIDSITEKTVDIISFLNEAIQAAQVEFAPLEQTVSVHISCSLKNVLKQEHLLLRLLNHIPAIELQKLNDSFCCGAAGSYMLSYPEVANRLLDDKIKNVMQQDSNLVVSSNLGCTLHFKQGLEKQGKSIEVIHPVQLLARQLIKKD